VLWGIGRFLAENGVAEPVAFCWSFGHFSRELFDFYSVTLRGEPMGDRKVVRVSRGSRADVSTFMSFEGRPISNVVPLPTFTPTFDDVRLSKRKSCAGNRIDIGCVQRDDYQRSSHDHQVNARTVRGCRGELHSSTAIRHETVSGERRHSSRKKLIDTMESWVVARLEAPGG
jgi:hypothetical protein